MSPSPSPARKALIALLALPEELAATVLSKLAPEALATLQQEAGALAEVGDDEVVAVLRELSDQVETPLAIARASTPSYLRRLLARAFGEERAADLLATSALRPAQRLEQAPAGALAELLTAEPPALAAMLLTQLSPAKVASVLERLPRERAADLLARLARTSQVPEQAAQVATQTLAQALEGSQELDGVRLPFDGQRFAEAVQERLQAARERAARAGDELAHGSRPAFDEPGEPGRSRRMPS